MNADEEAYKRARQGDFSGFETAYQEPEPPKASITGVPANMQRLVAAVQATGWDPSIQAQMIGAAFFDVETQVAISQAAQAAAAAGVTTDEANLEAAISAEVVKLKVKTEAERRVASEDYTGSELLSWEDLEDAHREYLIQDLVPQGGQVWTVARSNLAKTFTYTDAVCRMATGMPWMGKATKQAKTLIVLGEGKTGYMSRLKAWAKANGKDLAELRPWMFFMDRANLNNDESLKRIQDVATAEGIELVVFDTWAATSGVQREEDNALNSVTLSRIVDAVPDATLWFIHHPRKAEEDSDAPVMRGAGALQGRADVVMTMYRDHKFIPATGERFDFIALSTEAEHNGKNRDAQTETIRGLYLDEVVLDNGDIGRVLHQVSSETISKQARTVREVLTHEMDVRQFMEAAKVSKPTAYRYLEKGVAEGVCVKDERTATWKPNHAWTVLMGRAA